jgi:hypothetical protein
MKDLKHCKVTEPVPLSEKSIGLFFFVVLFGGWLILNLI